MVPCASSFSFSHLDCPTVMDRALRLWADIHSSPLEFLSGRHHSDRKRSKIGSVLSSYQTPAQWPQQPGQGARCTGQSLCSQHAAFCSRAFPRCLPSSFQSICVLPTTIIPGMEIASHFKCECHSTGMGLGLERAKLLGLASHRILLSPPST